jgi:hypothetical protein
MHNLLDELSYANIKVQLIQKTQFFILHKDNQLKRSLMKKNPKRIRNSFKEVI